MLVNYEHVYLWCLYQTKVAVPMRKGVWCHLLQRHVSNGVADFRHEAQIRGVIDVTHPHALACLRQIIDWSVVKLTLSPKAAQNPFAVMHATAVQSQIMAAMMLDGLRTYCSQARKRQDS